MAGFVLAALAGIDSDSDVMRSAITIGRKLDSHVRALHVRFDPAAVAGITAPGMSATMYEQMIDQANRESEQRARCARDAFDRMATGADRRDSPAPGFSVAWVEVMGADGGALAAHARGADLVVLTRPKDRQDVHAALAIESVLFEAGRPVIVVPPNGPTEWGRRVMLAWNGSAQSARAMFEALPLLRRAEQVSVVSAASEPGGSAEDAVGALAWQGLTAEPLPIEAAPADVAAQLFATAAHIDCDLVVMGGYGHSRMREFILGGVTRHALYETTQHLFLSH